MRNDQSGNSKKCTAKDAFLVISDNFIEKYRRCKKVSCMSDKNSISLLSFYKDNDCLIATVEDESKKVYGRTILFGKYYKTTYVERGHKTVFNKLLKEAGLKKIKGRATYPVKKMGNIPYIDDFDCLNKDFTYMSNYNDDEFCLVQNGEVPDTTTQIESIIQFKCPHCNEYFSMSRSIDENGFTCPECEEEKIELVNRFLKKSVRKTKGNLLAIEPLKIENKKGKRYFVFKKGDTPLIPKQ